MGTNKVYTWPVISFLNLALELWLLQPEHLHGVLVSQVKEFMLGATICHQVDAGGVLSSQQTGPCSSSTGVQGCGGVCGNQVSSLSEVVWGHLPPPLPPVEGIIFLSQGPYFLLCQKEIRSVMWCGVVWSVRSVLPVVSWSLRVALSVTPMKMAWPNQR